MSRTKSDEYYEIEESLRERARFLIQANSDEIGYIEIDKIIFLKLYSSNAKWLGKTWLIRKPMNMISEYVYTNFVRNSAENPSIEFAERVTDIRYIIALNETTIGQSGSDFQRMEDAVLLHELMHIDMSMEKLVKHDIEDFKWMLDRYGTGYSAGTFEEDLKCAVAVEEKEEPPLFTPPLPPPIVAVSDED